MKYLDRFNAYLKSDRLQLNLKSDNRGNIQFKEYEYYIIRYYLSRHQKLMAVKYIKYFTDLGLKDSKTIVDLSNYGINILSPNSKFEMFLDNLNDQLIYDGAGENILTYTKHDTHISLLKLDKKYDGSSSWEVTKTNVAEVYIEDVSTSNGMMFRKGDILLRPSDGLVVLVANIFDTVDFPKLSKHFL